MSRKQLIALPVMGAFFAFALLGAHCNSTKDASAGPLGTTPGAVKKEEPKGDAPKAPPAADDAIPNDGLTEAETAKLLPGIDTSMLTPKQRQDLLDMTGDTFCPCSSATVASCLRANSCKAAVRFTELAKQMFIDGQSQAGTLLRVESYYGSFQAERRRQVAPDGPSKGAEKGRVTLIEFSDFECPACRAAHPALDEMVKKYPADVRVVFRHFPLPRHAHSPTAAAAGAYAAEQGKFWKLADLMFERQENLADDQIQGMAKEVGLDPAALWKAITTEGNKYKAKVDEDLRVGNEIQINATPTIYVNGRQFILPATPKYLSWAIEDELEWIANGNNWTKR